ncbi:hypothetical protein FIBSPDRAFT_929773 [Athelia psychrophila]|uniref:Zona occludens toxin N-terminal domain-containing protein n=1 Tax=Athelia psychrophila TaxID=1759441 RepID=A0A166N231_9AGAM|nr:hypothetical protein FIBSPDRAFT_929773 [Fibularhizoctonia sp. CBS 109695]
MVPPTHTYPNFARMSPVHLRHLHTRLSYPMPVVLPFCWNTSGWSARRNTGGWSTRGSARGNEFRQGRGAGDEDGEGAIEGSAAAEDKQGIICKKVSLDGEEGEGKRLLRQMRVLALNLGRGQAAAGDLGVGKAEREDADQVDTKRAEYRARERLDEHRLRARGREDTQIAREVDSSSAASSWLDSAVRRSLKSGAVAMSAISWPGSAWLDFDGRPNHRGWQRGPASSREREQNTPFSIVICGVQGSGKSHTVACILECMFIPKYSPIGSLEKPLCGLVLHLGEGGPNSRPSEAAWLATSSYEGFQPPAIKVYVSPSSLRTMRGVYAALDGNITVEPLLLDEEELDAHAFLGMMAVSDSVVPPLYVQTMLSILRDLGEDYTYAKFKKVLEVKKKTWNPAQLSGLDQRLALLESFISKKEPRTRAAASPRFAAGQITIVDLSDPFIDTGSACGLFEVITRLFVRADVNTGRILVVDEAHKYLANNDSASGLTSTLLELTREQRHLGIRVIISTQEPTVIPPTLLDLCTVAIMHRFSSPAWWKALSVHVSADITSDKAFDKVVGLQPGEALVFAPSGLATFEAPGGGAAASLDKLKRRYLVMRTRGRVTKDGGASILVI